MYYITYTVLKCKNFLIPYCESPIFWQACMRCYQKFFQTDKHKMVCIYLQNANIRLSMIKLKWERTWESCKRKWSKRKKSFWLFRPYWIYSMWIKSSGTKRNFLNWFLSRDRVMSPSYQIRNSTRCLHLIAISGLEINRSVAYLDLKQTTKYSA